MGEYFKAVNHSKREFVHPHKIGCGLKLLEHLVNSPGTGAALVLLCARPRHVDPGDKITGRWAGDVVSLVSDYENPGVYERCISPEEIDSDSDLTPGDLYRDISDDVAEKLAAVVGHFPRLADYAIR